jgi:hypothetical protein
MEKKKLTTIERMEDFIKNETPFAVIQYYQNIIKNKDELNKVYDIIYINDLGRFSYINMNNEDVLFFREKLNTKDLLIIKNELGKVYEFNNFKEHYKKSNAKWH